MMLAVPLAWLQLTYEKSRLLVAIAGITFAVVLMFMQIGFQDALFRSAVRLQSGLRGDIVLISPQSTNIVGMRSFSRRRLYQTLGVAGVEAVSPMYIGLGAWKIKESTAGQTRNILILGTEPDDNVFKLEGMTPENIYQMKQQDVVLFDRTSRPEFGPIVKECGVEKEPQNFSCPQPVYREVANRRLKIGGLFVLGSSFAADGAIITSSTNFLRIFQERSEGLISVGLIKLQPGTDPYQVILDITKVMAGDHVVLAKSGFTVDGKRVQVVPDDPEKVMIRKTELTLADIAKTQDIVVDDVRVMTMQGFINFERSYWERSTAIGFIFGLGTIMGFIVGVVIVYQILYTDVSDHLAEYATLKAVGYSNWYLSGVVIQESVMLSVLGFLPGLIFSTGLYALTRNATRLPLYMTWERGIQVFLLTLIMCIISGSISLRRVQAADPAEMFS
ncbi:MAG: FtsX-like permease family protein [Pseudanabaenaceae cyanobacterium]